MQKKIPNASQLMAVGAFSETVTGFFDFSIKNYHKNTFNEEMEVLALTSNISLFKEKYKVRAHVVLGRKDGTAHGGHLIKGIAHPTLEISLNVSPGYLTRKMDKNSGLLLIKV